MSKQSVTAKLQPNKLCRHARMSRKYAVAPKQPLDQLLLCLATHGTQHGEDGNIQQ
jgi:hypothetical protein